MKIKKCVLTDFNHLGATHFSTLRDPYFGNRFSIGRGRSAITSTTFNMILSH